jgi:steroid 5-alpha reductase family enzyme
MAQKSSARAKSPAARSNATSTTPARGSSSIPKMPPSSSTTLEPQGFLQRAGKAVILACFAYAVVHLCTSYLEGPVGGFVRIVFGMQFAAYVLAAAFMTESFYDMIGTSTFIAATTFAGYTGSWNLQQKMITTMVCLWGTRLGIFLIHRFHHAGVDRRFDKAKTDPFLFFVYWTMQGVWVTVTLLPVVLVLIQHAPSHSFTGVCVFSYCYVS